MKTFLIGLDMDGVVFPTMLGYAKIFAKSLDGYDIPKQEAIKFYMRTGGMSAQDQYRTLLQTHEKPTDSVAELTRYFKGNAYNEMPELYDDVIESLAAVKGTGEYDIYGWTNTPQPTLDIRVQHHGLDRFLDFWLRNR